MSINSEDILYPENIKESPNNSSVTYTRLDHDPFVFRSAIKEPFYEENIPDKIDPPGLPSINYKIKGVVVGEKGKLVIFEDLTNKKTTFLREGESHMNLKVKRIMLNKVFLVENGAIKEINFEK